MGTSESLSLWRVRVAVDAESRELQCVYMVAPQAGQPKPGPVELPGVTSDSKIYLLEDSGLVKKISSVPARVAVLDADDEVGRRLRVPSGPQPRPFW
jgi:hypothetical protein